MSPICGRLWGVTPWAKESSDHTAPECVGRGGVLSQAGGQNFCGEGEKGVCSLLRTGA